MTTRSAIALLAAAWLLAGCASFGEGVTRGLLARSEEPAVDTRECEVSGPAFSGILPMLERQDGYPIGQAGPERPILKVIMVHGVGTHVPAMAPASAPTWRGRSASRWSRPTPLSDRGGGLPRRDARHADRHAPHQHGPRSGDAVLRAHLVADQPASQRCDRLRQHRGLRSPAGERQQPVQALHQRRRPRSPGLHRHRTRAYQRRWQALCWALSADWQGLPDEQQLCTLTIRLRLASTSTSSRSSPTVSAAGSPPTA